MSDSTPAAVVEPTGEPASAPSPSSAAWRGALLAGLLPVLAGGFAASALANRIVFAAWALVVATAYVFALYRSFARPAPLGRRALAPAAVLAAGLALFMLLAVRHGELLRLGLASLQPAAPAPWEVAP